MKRWMVLLVAALLILGAVPVMAADDDADDDGEGRDLKWFGSLRVRPEYNENLSDAFGGRDDKIGYLAYRARLGTAIELDRNARVVLDTQVAGLWGEDQSPFRAQPSMGTNASSFSVFQAYVEVDNVFDTAFSAKLGRQTMEFGDEWLMGDLDFYGGTSWDAMRGDFERENGSVTLFWAKAAEMDSPELAAVPPSPGDVGDDASGDWNLSGIWTTWGLPGEQDLEAALIYSFDHRRLPSTSTGGFPYQEKRWTYTMNYRYGGETGLFATANAAYQWGRIPDSTLVKQEIAADAVELTGGWTFNRDGGNYSFWGRFANYSGDDPSTSDIESFDALAQDFHGRHGYLDFWNGAWGFEPLLGGNPGLQVQQFGFKGYLPTGVSVGGQFQRLRATADIPFTGSQALGQEFGFVIGYDYGDNINVELGLAQLYPGSGFLAIGAFNGNSSVRRFYVNTVATF